MPQIKIATDQAGISKMIREAYDNIADKSNVVDQGSLVPPWGFQPNHPRNSLFWRMGGGEDYLSDFSRLFCGLDTPGRLSFVTANPEPSDWSGFYASLCG
jgi:hypothetical protein